MIRADGPPALWRLRIDGHHQLARGPADAGPIELLGERSVDVLLGGGAGALAAALEQSSRGAVPDGATVACPLERQEVWAAGVTYERSREARTDESDTPDPYERVYVAKRPELFAKAAPGRAVGAGEDIGIRADSSWDVPEPELGLVLDARGQIVAYVLGNDVSSRSIEGENPLYLPQAKVYDRSCAVGPCLVPVGAVGPLDELELGLHIERDGAAIFTHSIRLSALRRSPEELVSWLFRATGFPSGVVLLTGTGIVPPPELTLEEGDVVTVSGSGLGSLRNVVRVVGRP